MHSYDYLYSLHDLQIKNEFIYTAAVQIKINDKLACSRKFSACSKADEVFRSLLVQKSVITRTSFSFSFSSFHNDVFPACQSNHKVKTCILLEIKLNFIPEKHRPLGAGMDCLDCRDDYFGVSHIGKWFINLFNVLQPITANLLFFDQSEVKLKPVKTLIMRVFPRSAPVALTFGLNWKFRSVHCVFIIYCDWSNVEFCTLAAPSGLCQKNRKFQGHYSFDVTLQKHRRSLSRVNLVINN